MKTTKILLFLLLFLSGCATYKFQKGQPPHDKGYVVSRDSYTILEYTIGKENSPPDDLESAKERFKRRRTSVEYYYKKIGSVENRFKQIFLDYPVLFVKFMGGIFRLPFIAISDYKYEHDPQYREKVRMREEKEDLSERERIKSFKEELNKYIQNDLKREASTKESTSKMPVPIEEKTEEVKSPTTAALVEKEEGPAGTKPEEEKPPKAEPSEVLPQQKKEESERVAEEWLKNMEMEKQTKELSQGCQAIIIANSTKGYSPLKVKFNGLHSRSPAGKIISYYWEFGDGDTSTKPNPTNTYWSTTYGWRYFTVTLTVKDSKGNTATATRIIEVINK